MRGNKRGHVSELVNPHVNKLVNPHVNELVNPHVSELVNPHVNELVNPPKTYKQALMNEEALIPSVWGAPANLTRPRATHRPRATPPVQNARVSTGNPRNSVEYTPDQGQTDHCALYGICDIVTRMCARIYSEIPGNELFDEPLFQSVRDWYESRIKSDTSDDQSVDLDWLTFFVYELNHGFVNDLNLLKDDPYDPDSVGTVIEGIKDAAIPLERIFDHLPQFRAEFGKPYYIDGSVYRVLTAVQQKIRDNGLNIKINSLDYRTATGKPEGYYVTQMLHFIKDDVCIIGLKFSASGERKLMYPPSDGVIKFTYDDFMQEDDSFAHAMVIHNFRPVWTNGKFVGYELVFENSWGKKWGKKILSETSGREINIAYFAIDDNILLNTIMYVSYLSLVPKPQELTANNGRDTVYISKAGKGLKKTRKKNKKTNKTKKNKKKKRTLSSSHRKKRRSNKRVM
jgi:hypothetical protein